MAEDTPSLHDILSRVLFRYRKRIDFRSTDAETLPEIVNRLTNAAFCFNILSITDFGGRTGREREKGLVEHVIGAAFQLYADVDPHPQIFQKAAMLLRGITQGHPFTDGNKRTGFLTVMYYLQQVGYPEPEELPVDDVVEFCRQVSAGEIRDIDHIAIHLAQFWEIPYP